MAAACQVQTTPVAPVAQPADVLGQARCGVNKSADKPLVVEWPAAERAALEARASQGLVAVRYEGCEMQVLSHCDVPGEYAYVGTTTKRESVRIRNADELYARLPVGAASLEAQLERSGELTVDLTVVGRKEASDYDVSRYALEGSCEGATHFVSGLTVGAFSLYTGREIGGGGGVQVASAGVGGTRTSTRETLRDDGDPTACAVADHGDEAPPSGCAALLRVEVIPLSSSTVARVEPTPEPAVIAEPAPTPEPLEMPQIDPSMMPTIDPATMPKVDPSMVTDLIETDPSAPDPCAAIDFEVVKIGRKRADPPFHDRAMDRVTLKISNRGDTAMRLDGGSDALFLDADKNILTADIHDEFFMPRRLPAGSSVVVRILMRRHAGKTLQAIEIGARPAGSAFADCRVIDRELTPTLSEPPPEPDTPADPSSTPDTGDAR